MLDQMKFPMKSQEEMLIDNLWYDRVLIKLSWLKNYFFQSSERKLNWSLTQTQC